MTEASESRVYLRSVTRRDRQEFLALMNESRHLHEPWISPPLTPFAFQNYLTRTQREDHAGLLICLCKTDEIAGIVNLNNIVRGTFLSASLGYYGTSRHAGLGYMQEGLEQAIRHAFETLGLHRLEANIQPDNHRSLTLARRCGFVKEGLSHAFLFIDGRWRDHERWAIYHPRSQLYD